MLPKDIKAFNTGSSIQRWSNKRPRLRSAKNQIKQDEDSAETDLDSLDVSNLMKELQSECEEDENNEFKQEQPEELDPDIKKLIEEIDKKGNADACDGATIDSKRISFELEDKLETDTGHKRKSKRKHKKKSKDEKDKEKSSKSKKKLTKTVSFSLSKPPTPQTEQVIRVDVISNYSMEFAMESNRTDAMLSEPSRFSVVESVPATIAEPKSNGSFMFQVFCTEKQEEKKDFILESKKAVLFPRGAEK